MGTICCSTSHSCVGCLGISQPESLKSYISYCIENIAFGTCIASKCIVSLRAECWHRPLATTVRSRTKEWCDGGTTAISGSYACKYTPNRVYKPAQPALGPAEGLARRAIQSIPLRGSRSHRSGRWCRALRKENPMLSYLVSWCAVEMQCLARITVAQTRP